MRAQFIVRLLEEVEGALLGVEVGSRRPGGARLERFVEAFVGPILLGAAGRDALVGDAELEPPDVEPVEAVNAGGGEGRAGVTADRVGEAAGAEQVAEVRADPGPRDVQESLTAEQVATEVLDEGQRVAIDAVAGAELAFEVDGPDLVRGGGGERGGAGMLPPTVESARVGAAGAGEDIEDGAARRL